MNSEARILYAVAHRVPGPSPECPCNGQWKCRTDVGRSKEDCSSPFPVTDCGHRAATARSKKFPWRWRMNRGERLRPSKTRRAMDGVETIGKIFSITNSDGKFSGHDFTHTSGFSALIYSLQLLGFLTAMVRVHSTQGDKDAQTLNMERVAEFEV